MNLFRKNTNFFVALFIAFLMVGCAPQARQRVLWPVYPATPRIEWLGTYASQYDFPKSRKDVVSDYILGGNEPEGFKSPYGIVRDSRGLIYVADALDGNLRVYNPHAKTVEYYTKEPSFARPAGLTIDAADNLYVVDSEARAVHVYNKDRKPLRAIGSPGELLSPAYIAIDQARSRIYVSDPRGNRIVIYDRFGKKSGEISGKTASGKGVYALSSPQGMAIDKAGNLYVAELLGARISVFDAQGTYLRSFGMRGDAVYQFEAPRDLAFDSDGNLWVLDIRRAQIYTYTPDGVLLLATGTSAPSSHPLGFSTPTAIYIAPDDTIYVTDRVNRRFSVWRYFSERYLKEHPLSAEEQAYLQEVGSKIITPPEPQVPIGPVGPVGPVKSETAAEK